MYFKKHDVRGIPEEEIEHVMLWRAVMDQALEDLLFPYKTAAKKMPNYLKVEAEANHRSARAWFKGIKQHDEDTAGFYTVADLAWIDPIRARGEVERIFKAQTGEQL